MIFNTDIYSKDINSVTEHMMQVEETISLLIEKAEKAFRLYDISINTFILMDVIKKTFDDLLRYTKEYNNHQEIIIPDHYKEAAHLAYWIRRLKPLSYIRNSKYQVNIEYAEDNIRWVNERVAIHLAEFICISGIKQNGKEPARLFINPELRDDFLYIFRYKHVSPHSLMIFFKSIFDQ